jgi:RNA polymerase sigma-70 factor, ECF subfamily
MGGDDSSMTASSANERAGPVPYDELLERARRRDGEAFARLYEATYQRVFSYLLARLGDRSAAEDLLQEVYLAALHGIDRFRAKTEGQFMAWILKIAHGKSVDQLRSRYRHPDLVTSDVAPVDADNPLDTIDMRLGLGEIAAALSQLTEDQRNVVMNRLVFGYDLEETAGLMGKNVGSIKALQHRALARLAKLLGPGGHEHA